MTFAEYAEKYGDHGLATVLAKHQAKGETTVQAYSAADARVQAATLLDLDAFEIKKLKLYYRISETAERGG